MIVSPPFFRNRAEAGARLADLLSGSPRPKATVLALPRGGVPIAVTIAERLHAPWDVFIVRKVAAPGNPEYGLGAVAEGGIVLIDDERAREVGIGPGELAEEIQEQQAEVERRVQEYRHGRPGLPVEGRAVILVDDGLATGGTARTAVRALRTRSPRSVTLAVGVASREAYETLAPEVDEIICPCLPPWFSAVGEWYREFDQVSDSEVLRLLAGDRSTGRPSPSSLPPERSRPRRGRHTSP